MRTRLWSAVVVTACVGAGLLSAAPAQAADEWTAVGTFAHACDPDYGGHQRVVESSVRGGDAAATYDICWTNGFDDVRVAASVSDGNGNDGYHAEARIRYEIYTGGAWSGWHYRTPSAAYGPGDHGNDGLFKAVYPTRMVQVAACLYNGSTVIDCDDRGWR
ncbi:hypothetical protein HH310_28980 [Actinoplanes sp. TBRC 11911]|uniref:hypothetical protein n=1 Tax=Actinoplanes sp. TBRC 11911 TaxID=2729386 RepID=UPI00145F4D23|nr:hypothetical protein [Actinoplanes sp. TBRC 11911]NMO55206.1 hypothetical protein [Actinoplanes sp. TBRC 11911]